MQQVMQVQQAGHKHGTEAHGHQHIVGEIMLQHEYVPLTGIQLYFGIQVVV